MKDLKTFSLKNSPNSFRRKGNTEKCTPLSKIYKKTLPKSETSIKKEQYSKSGINLLDPKKLFSPVVTAECATQYSSDSILPEDSRKSLMTEESPRFLISYDPDNDKNTEFKQKIASIIKEVDDCVIEHNLPYEIKIPKYEYIQTIQKKSAPELAQILYLSRSIVTREQIPSKYNITDQEIITILNDYRKELDLLNNIISDLRSIESMGKIINLTKKSNINISKLLEMINNYCNTYFKQFYLGLGYFLSAKNLEASDYIKKFGIDSSYLCNLKSLKEPDEEILNKLDKLKNNLRQLDEVFQNEEYLQIFFCNYIDTFMIRQSLEKSKSSNDKSIELAIKDLESYIKNELKQISFDKDFESFF